jgi:4-alpha-glucanotransferase
MSDRVAGVPPFPPGYRASGVLLHITSLNVPGRAEGNWRWRCTDEMLSTCAFEWLRDLTKLSGRSQGGS